MHHKHCIAFCWLSVHYVVFLFTFYSLLTFQVPPYGYSVYYHEGLWHFNAEYFCGSYFSDSLLQATRHFFRKPCTEYQNWENGNFCNSNCVYNRVTILPENYLFPLSTSSFIPPSRHSICILLIYFPAHSALKTVL